MDIYDLTTLGKDSSGNYDLTQLTFQLQFGSINFAQYQVQQGEEMRIDLVCQSIYGNVKYIDILCNVNNIDNPLNIQEGAIILYPTNDVDLLRYSGVDNTSDIATLANSNKSTRKDTNRKLYVENNLSLPPTILEQTTNQFDITGNNIILGDGLF